MRRLGLAAGALATSAIGAVALIEGTTGRSTPAGSPRSGAALLVTLSPRATLAGLPSGTRVTELSPSLGDVIVTLPAADAREAGQLIADLRGQPGVIAVQRNDTWHSAATGTECAPRPDAPVTYQAAAVDADKVTSPPSTSPIAVLDTGVDATAPELAGRVRAGANVVNGGTKTTDTQGHGTAVAAVAAARAGEVLGVSPTSPIIPIKILDAQGTSSAAWVVAGINAALARGAGVINISATGPSSSRPGQDDQVVMRAIDTAVSRGVVVVAPSGNEGSGRVDVPASYPHVLTVAATGTDGLPASFSNRGAAVDLTAPGEALTEPAPKSVCPSGYQLVSGTSFAAPAVAGAAALLAAAHPGLTATQRLEMLRRGPAAGSTSAWSASSGFGSLNVAAALGATVPPVTPAEVNDDVFWVTRASRAGRTALAPGAALGGRIDMAKNPLDVFPVHLRRGGRLTASLTVTGGQASLALWDPRTGAFDIGLGRGRHRLSSTSAGSKVTLRGRAARVAGTYFVSVQARRTPPGGSAYRLTASGR